MASLSLASASPAAAQAVSTMAVGAEATEDLMVTVYNNGYGLVREIREIELPEGIIELEFRDVAQMIDPTSVAFKSLTSPGEVGILEQNYRYDLLSPATLLEKFVGREVTLIENHTDRGWIVDRKRTGLLFQPIEGNVVQFDDEMVMNPRGKIVVNETLQAPPATPGWLDRFTGREVTVTEYRSQGGWTEDRHRTGTLLSTRGGNIIQFGDEIVINPRGTIALAEVPDDLLARPTLLWLLRNGKAGTHRIETSYLTNGMSWKADYVVILNDNDDKFDITGWVTLENKSGATYDDALLKLVAGEVQRVEPGVWPAARRTLVMSFPDAMDLDFQEKAFFEYHLYTLGRRTTLANNESKQITLLEGADVAVKKSYVLESQMWRHAVKTHAAEIRRISVMIEFENKEDNNLGMALPAGRLRFYKATTTAHCCLSARTRFTTRRATKRFGSNWQTR